MLLYSFAIHGQFYAVISIFRLSLRNNQFEDTPIQLIGEGYEEDISIDNVRGQLGTISDQDLLQSSSSEEISGTTTL